MWNKFLILIGLTAVFATFSSSAEQKKQLGNWDVHYMVLSTTFLTPEIAKANNIVRSRFSSLVNISVLDNTSKVAQSVAMSGSATNLLGTKKELSFKQVKEGDAIYYLALLDYRNRETYRFKINIQQGNITRTLSFQQELFVN
jgi:hypothetical protein